MTNAGPPRTDTPPFPQRTGADTTGDVSRVLSKLDAAGINKRIIRTLANSPTAFRPFMLLSTQLLASEFFPRLDQEIVILHLAAQRDTQYEWEEHVPMALESAVTQQQVDAIARDGAAVDQTVFTDDQLLAVAFADELTQHQHVAPATWQRVIGRWGEQGGLDLLMTVAVWGALVPTIIEGLDLVHA